MKGFGPVVAILCMILAAIGGYVSNIVKLLGGDATVIEWTAMEIARVIGIFFPPLGIILGYC